jgi:hypothetical protein
MTTIIVPLHGLLNSRKKPIFNLDKIAKEHKLHFSNFDEVGSNIIAIDSTKRKLLYVNNSPVTSSCLIIDLNDLKECTIRKSYDSINAGDLNKRKMSHFLKNIFLNLRFRNGSPSVTLPLYEAQKNYGENVEQLETKAKKWSAILTNLLPILKLERA